MTRLAVLVTALFFAVAATDFSASPGWGGLCESPDAVSAEACGDGEVDDDVQDQSLAAFEVHAGLIELAGRQWGHSLRPVRGHPEEVDFPPWG